MLVDGGFIQPADGERWGVDRRTRPHPDPAEHPGACWPHASTGSIRRNEGSPNGPRSSAGYSRTER